MVGGPLGVALGDLVAGRAQDQDRGTLDRLQQLVQEVEEGGLGPVQVVDEHHDRALCRERLQESSAAPHQLRNRELRGAEVDRGRDPLHDRLAILGRGLLQQPVDSSRGNAGRVLVGDPGRLSNDLGERPEGDAVAIGQAAPAHQPGTFGGRRGELADQA